MKRTIYLLCSFLLCSLFTIAQSGSVKGKVTNASGAPVVGATVFFKEAKKKVLTDKDGKFSIESSKKTGSVIVTATGYKSNIVNIDGTADLSIILEDAEIEIKPLSKLNYGYGNTKIKSYPGSSASISAYNLKEITVNTASEAIAGKLAGLQVISSEGAEGASALVSVRGATSFFQNNAPLYIINGLPVENGLSAIAPQDIETIDVLKDAAGTALYGIRGANGVVVITTKIGKSGNVAISYNGFVGVNQFAKDSKLDVLDPYNYVLYQYERSRGDAAAESAFLNTYGPYSDLTKYQSVSQQDWQDEVFGANGILQTHNVNLSGGNPTTQYYLGLTYNGNNGQMEHSKYERKLVTFRLDNQATEKLKVGFSFRFNDEQNNGAGVSDPRGQVENRLRHTVQYRPFLLNGISQDAFDYSYYKQTLTGDSTLGIINPFVVDQQEYRKNYFRDYNFGANAAYKISNFISFKTLLGLDYNDIRHDAVSGVLTPSSFINAGNDSLDLHQAGFVNKSNGMLVTNTNQLVFSNTLFDPAVEKPNELEIILGEETNSYREKRFVNGRYDVPTFLLPEKVIAQMNQGSPIPGTPFASDTKAKMLSFFGKINYAYNKKYTASFTLRSDRVSKGSSKTEWGYFPAGALAWDISKENFMKNSKSISNLKLRVSYGASGNKRLSDFDYLNLLVVPDSGYIISQTNIPWQTTTSLNGGIDFSIAKNRVNLSLDGYKNTTKDITVPATVLPVSNINDLRHVGELSNKGVELQINAVVLRKKNFTWAADFNIAYNKSEIINAGEKGAFTYSSGWGTSAADYIIQKGGAFGDMYGFVADGFYNVSDFEGLAYNGGVWDYSGLKQGVPDNVLYLYNPQPGSIKFKDTDGNGVVDLNDRTVIGNASPAYFGGLNQRFYYKNFELGVLVNFAGGNDIYNANAIAFTSGYVPGANLLASTQDRWRTINDQGNVITDAAELASVNAGAKTWQPNRTAENYLHSGAIEDGSYIRLSNITLGYSLPGSVINKYRISRLRFFITANNLAVITGYSGFDPEVNVRDTAPLTQGVDYSAYPRTRSFVFGVNLSL